MYTSRKYNFIAQPSQTFSYFFRKRLCICLLLFLFRLTSPSHVLYAQADYAGDYFRSPLDIPLSLVGNFGEIRSNHFHSGLDIRTEQAEGKNVYAIADGYVSRIKVSAWGFGYALYVNHPNGYTSVYGHLKEYSGKIALYVKEIQYKKESFEIDVFPGASDLPVKKGDVIALSGNSGISSGPHLHFEIRETKTEYPVNPLLFGFDVPDHKAPVIGGLEVYTPANGKTSTYELNGGAGNYTVPGVVSVHGKFGLAISTSDAEDGSRNKNGVYSVELRCDGKSVCYYDLEKFSFAETRYVNAHIDYEEKLSHGTVFQRSFVLPGNRVSIYKNMSGNGFLDFRDTSLHEIQFIVKDVPGNTATLIFLVQAHADSGENLFSPTGSGAIFSWDKANTFSSPDIRIDMPGGVLYDTIHFSYSKEESAKYHAPVYRIYDSHTPVHSYYSLSVKASVPPRLRDKACMVSIGSGGVAACEGGVCEDGFVKADVRSFGRFTVMIDTVKPFIKPVNISPGKNMKGENAITFKISDNLSGIKSYRASVDGQWVLMAFDGKSGTLSHAFDGHVSPGNHEFLLRVEDKKGNNAEFICSFSR